MKNKEEIIEQLKALKNIPLGEQKKNPFENADPDKHKMLMQYNIMLDNITIGFHTTTTIEYAGIEWTFRLLSAKEFTDIRLQIDKKCKDEDTFADYYILYHLMVKILAKAMTPSPLKTTGKTIFSEEDLSYLPYDILHSLYVQYLDFVNSATKKPTEFTDEEVEEMINIAKKKPELLREYERPKLLKTALWFMNYSKHLEKMLKSDTNN